VKSRLVALAVAGLAAVAVLDAFRGPSPRAAGDRAAVSRPATALLDAGGFSVAGQPPTRVLHKGRLYLTAQKIDEAFPPPLEAVLYSIGHVASAPDGTVAVAIYNFGAAGSPRNVIELWRHGRLVNSFPVPPGTFGGGIGFTQDGQLGARAPRGNRTTFFPTGG
jgi:hypothetical protein